MENKDVVKQKSTVQRQDPTQVVAAPKNIGNAKRKSLTLEEKRAIEADMRRDWENDSQMVKGIFRYNECPNGSLSFNFLKYKWDESKSYTLKDGEVYELPLMVAKHLNSNCSYPSYNYKNDINGRPVVTLSEKIRRTSFQGLEFVDQRDEKVRAALASNPSSGLTDSATGLGIPR